MMYCRLPAALLLKVSSVSGQLLRSTDYDEQFNIFGVLLSATFLLTINIWEGI